jgi:NADPH2:quinone reductase
MNMRAQVVDRFGEPDVFTLRELPDLEPGPGEVVVALAATSVNPVDYKVRRFGPSIAPALPAVLGSDVAGTILAVGEGVTDFAVGDEVYGCAGGVAGVRGGSYAEQIVADPRLLAPKPAQLRPREAAALPLVTITAWEGLDRAGVAPGSTLLIHGGAGGVGHVAIQLAKARGARVFATVSSPEKAEIARRLGADETINYREEGVESYVQRLTGGRGFDVVFDATGGDDLLPSFAAARLNGQVVTIVSSFTADLSPMHAKGLTLHVVFMLIPMLHDLGREAHGALLREAAMLADAGRLTPLIDPERFTLEQVAQAHAKAEAGKAVGKIVVDIGFEARSGTAA